MLPWSYLLFTHIDIEIGPVISTYPSEINWFIPLNSYAFPEVYGEVIVSAELNTIFYKLYILVSVYGVHFDLSYNVSIKFKYILIM